MNYSCTNHTVQMIIIKKVHILLVNDIRVYLYYVYYMYRGPNRMKNECV